ncbi:nitrate- and nitrite sensing domain-containing protein [Actinomadura sp. LOL_016]|uniref:sensor histidine kinase n=1 Tax=unclassified Actinomadura TaxID=2626254 RepID=UPI003A8112A7
MADNPEGPPSRRRGRPRPVRRRLAFLLVVPLLSLTALWAFATASAVGAAVARNEYTTAVNDVGTPIGLVGEALRMERAATVTALVSGGSRDGRLGRGRQGTDGALAVFRQKALPLARDVVDAETRRALRDLDRELGRIRELRGGVDAKSVTPLEAIDRYTALADGADGVLFRLTTSLAQATGGMVSSGAVNAYQAGQGNLHVFAARDSMMREDALLTIARARGERMSTAEYAAFVRAVADRRQMADLSLDGPSGVVRGALAPMNRSPEFARYRELEDAIIAAPGHRLPSAVLAEWRTVHQAVSEQWFRALNASAAAVSEQSDSAGRTLTYQLAGVGGVGLLIVLASIGLSWRFSRDISRELRALQRVAQELAHRRLPGVVARLRDGEKVDVAEEAPPVPSGRTAEVVAVAEAFGAVQRTAIGTAVGEARIRAGVSSVFINLAWRSQSLLHRQLEMLDAMERRASDPDELESLFRLDHLTTRMRRHAEGLVILSGNENVRGWNEPVEAEQVLRAAVAEVEDYARVDVMALSPVRLAGAVVADVVHLLAELIENATAYSPPTTEVLVRAERVGNGLAVEVIDRGIGLDADDLAATNRRLAEPPEFDLADSDRLGLFVVARLAARHGIEVVLQRSAYGGVTAITLVPAALLAEDGAPGSTGAAALTGRAPLGTGATPPALVPSGPVGRFLGEGRHRAQEPVADAPDDAGYDVETGGLPRRTRGRKAAVRVPTAPAEDEADFGDRPAEDNRDLLSSLQEGWTAARDEDEDGSTVFDERGDR